MSWALSSKGLSLQVPPNPMHIEGPSIWTVSAGDEPLSSILLKQKHIWCLCL